METSRNAFGQVLSHHHRNVSHYIRVRLSWIGDVSFNTGRSCIDWSIYQLGIRTSRDHSSFWNRGNIPGVHEAMDQ